MSQRLERLGTEGLVIEMPLSFCFSPRLSYQTSSPFCQAEVASTLRSKRHQ